MIPFNVRTPSIKLSIHEKGYRISSTYATTD